MQSWVDLEASLQESSAYQSLQLREGAMKNIDPKFLRAKRASFSVIWQTQKTQ